MSVAPLTEVFTPASGCLATTAAHELYKNKTSYHVIGALPSQTECFPTSYTASIDAVYSPGTCPDRYTAVCVSARVTGSPQTTETRNICCPDIGSYQFTCPTQTTSLADPWESTLGCVSEYQTAVTLAALTTVSGGATTVAAGSTVLAAPTSGATGTLYAHGVQVAYRAGDTFTTGGGNRNNNTNNGNGKNTKSVNKGTAIGVGVGVGVAVVLIVAGAFLMWRRRRQKRAVAASREGEQVEEEKDGEEQRMMAAGGEGPTVGGSPVELPPENVVPGPTSQRSPVEVMGDLPPGAEHYR